jgi:fused signal recognition particle receptor
MPFFVILIFVILDTGTGTILFVRFFMAIFASWSRGLGKTRKNWFTRISELFQSGNQLSDDLFDELEALLLESDVGIETTADLIDEMRSVKFGQEHPAVEVRKWLRERIQHLLQTEASDNFTREKPYVQMVVGVNGTGKTTTIGKLAWKLRARGDRVLLACSDTFRAAAGEQLEIWAKRAQADCIRQQPGADPASVAFDALDAAIARGIDTLLIDTAGRLHTKAHLMEELKKIRRVLDKRLPGAPHSVLLVLDSTTGQNGLRQAEQFTLDIGVTELALTKLDGTARGGIVLAIRRKLGLPVRWVGVGEGIDDLLPFDARAFAEALLGEGQE